MSPRYMAVQRVPLQRAFAKAHRGACDETLTPELRRRFKEISAEIWRACGENQALPATLPAGFPGNVVALKGTDNV